MARSLRAYIQRGGGGGAPTSSATTFVRPSSLSSRERSDQRPDPVLTFTRRLLSLGTDHFEGGCYFLIRLVTVFFLILKSTTTFHIFNDRLLFVFMGQPSPTNSYLLDFYFCVLHFFPLIRIDGFHGLSLVELLIDETVFSNIKIVKVRAYKCFWG